MMSSASGSTRWDGRGCLLEGSVPWGVGAESEQMSDVEVKVFKVLSEEVVRLGKVDEAGKGTGGNSESNKGGMFGRGGGPGGNEGCRKNRVRWADMGEDSEMQEAERTSQQIKGQDLEEGNRQMGEEQREVGTMEQDELLEQAKAVQHGDLAAAEEREQERQMEKSQGGEGDTRDGTGT